MNDHLPAWTGRFLEAQAAVFVPPAVEVIRIAFRVVRPDHLRHVISDGAQALLALAQLLLDLLAAADVMQAVDRADDRAVAVFDCARRDNDIAPLAALLFD